MWVYRTSTPNGIWDAKKARFWFESRYAEGDSFVLLQASSCDVDLCAD